MTVLSYRQALHDTLRAKLQRDENVFLIGEEIGVFEGSYKITAGLLAEFGPRRVRDTPICEEGFTGVAIGAAMMGLRPVVEIMTINFSLLAIDQIVNNAAKLRSLSGGQVSVPLVIRTPGAGGQQLSATHSQNLEVWYAHVPGLKVVAPATPADAKGLLAAAIRDDDPVLVLENLALYNTKGEVPDGEYLAEIGPIAVIGQAEDVPAAAAPPPVPAPDQAERAVVPPPPPAPATGPPPASTSRKPPARAMAPSRGRRWRRRLPGRCGPRLAALRPRLSRPCSRHLSPLARRRWPRPWTPRRSR
jgi:pyruvate/2-oxoglutarate/acetoin dehydrogenase E1 component